MSTKINEIAQEHYNHLLSMAALAKSGAEQAHATALHWEGKYEAYNKAADSFQRAASLMGITVTKSTTLKAA